MKRRPHAQHGLSAPTFSLQQTRPLRPVQQQRQRQWRAVAEAVTKGDGRKPSGGGEEVVLHFLPEDVYTTAQPGDSILEAAHAAGVVISTGCNSGSCGACEVCKTDGAQAHKSWLDPTQLHR